MPNDREIRQLMFLAQHYFELAKIEKSKLPTEAQKLEMTPKGLSDKTDFHDPTTKGLNYFSGHIGSAAVRLASIDDMIKSARYKHYYKDIWKSENVPNKKDNCIIMHYLLRNNVAHAEEDAPKKKKLFKENLMNYFHNLQFNEIYSAMQKVLSAIQTETGCRF